MVSAPRTIISKNIAVRRYNELTANGLHTTAQNQYKEYNTMAENTENIKAAKDIKGDEEIKDPRKKREIIKTIIIVFLVVLLALTFF